MDGVNVSTIDSPKLFQCAISGRLIFVGLCLLMSELVIADGWDPKSRASNIGSIINTRHNLTMSYLRGREAFIDMEATRNNYFEVCVYCHTPHGANRQLDAPLWNRSKLTTNYALYTFNFTGASPRDKELRLPDLSLTYDQPVTRPGPNSMTCLSCHDGALAVDSIINMPTRPTGARSGYTPSIETANASQATGFLDAWDLVEFEHPFGRKHRVLANTGADTSCMACHIGSPLPGSNRVAPDFRVFDIAEFAFGANINWNLRNDHPIGVTYPTNNAQPNANYPPYVNVTANYNIPTGSGVSASGLNYAYFDTNGSATLDKNEIRLYNSGDGAEVECASCHDPHGVPESGPGTPFIPSFLRVTNAGSQLCFTCHNK